MVIGSCTNGRMDDLRVAASILKGHRVAKGLRVIVIPATQQIYLDAMEEGLLKTFIEAGAVVSTPTCGPCLGGYMGILAEHERCVSTNKPELCRQKGHVESEIYWQVRLWRRQAPSPESYPDRMRLHRRGKETEHESSKGSCI